MASPYISSREWILWEIRQRRLGNHPERHGNNYGLIDFVQYSLPDFSENHSGTISIHSTSTTL